MSETFYVVTFVVVVYVGFYYLAYRAEKEVRAKAKQRLEEQEKMKKDPAIRHTAGQTIGASERKRKSIG